MTIRGMRIKDNVRIRIDLKPRLEVNGDILAQASIKGEIQNRDDLPITGCRTLSGRKMKL